MIRVAITTDRFEKAALPYRDAGLEPISLPCIRVDPAPDAGLDQARREAAAAELLLIGSARVIEFLWPEGKVPQIPTAAVGEQTAAAWRGRQGQVELVGTAGLGELITELRPQLEGRRVAFPHSASTDPVLLARLERIAGELWAAPVYRTDPVAPPPTRVHAAAFASPSAVNGWLRTRNLEHLVVGAIGFTTAETLRRHRPPDVVAVVPSHQALASALASYLEVNV